MNFEGKEFAEEFETAFGISIKSATVKQLWWLTKFAKHVRMRCKNNAAFNNYMNRNFSHMVFREVQKANASGETYAGLEIQEK
jgi:hypothetical protein